MTVEELTLRTGRGLRLAATLHRPAVAGPAGGVVVCHGMLSSRSSAKHAGVCEELSRRGLLALRFDFAGRGDSEGSTEELTYEGQVEQLGVALEALSGEVGRIGLIGSSMGGAVAILCASQRPSIAAVAGVAAVGRPEAVLRNLLGPAELEARAASGRGFELDGQRLGPGLIRSASRTDVVAAARSLSCPLLLIHGELDSVVPLSQARELAATAPDARLVVIPGGDHLLHRPEDQQLLERTLGDFLELHLGRPLGR